MGGMMSGVGGRRLQPNAAKSMNSCMDAPDEMVTKLAGVSGVSIKTCAEAAEQGLCSVAASLCPKTCDRCQLAEHGRTLQSKGGGGGGSGGNSAASSSGSGGGMNSALSSVLSGAMASGIPSVGGGGGGGQGTGGNGAGTGS
eukprot:3638094-Prymnesium_polylepis.1